jgi:hypothetical protein
MIMKQLNIYLKHQSTIKKNYIHIELIQVGVKLLSREGLNIEFNDFLLETIESFVVDHYILIIIQTSLCFSIIETSCSLYILKPIIIKFKVYPHLFY